MTEKQVHDFCKTQAIFGVYCGTRNEHIQLFQLSGYNRFSGPDFELVGVRINHLTWYGALEIHIESRDWYRHRHHLDPVYDRVVLHLVLVSNTSVLNSAGRYIPEIQIPESWILNSLRKSTSINFNAQMQRPNANQLMKFAQTRLKRKAEFLVGHKPHCLSWKQLFYRSIGIGFGRNANCESFIQLTTKLPISKVEHYALDLSILVVFLFNMAGFASFIPRLLYNKNGNKLFEKYMATYSVAPMISTHWKNAGMRPSNQVPNLLLKLGVLIHAHFFNLYSKLDQLTLPELRTQLSIMVKSSAYTHLNLPTITSGFIQSLIINSICPYVYAKGVYLNNEQLRMKAFRWLEQCNFEINYKTRNYVNTDLPNNAAISQGILEWKESKS